MNPRIMYIESKAGGLTGPARIGRVRFSKTGATLYYAGQYFQSLKGNGFKSNYYWLTTSPPRSAAKSLHGAQIDERHTQPVNERPSFSGARGGL